MSTSRPAILVALSMSALAVFGATPRALAQEPSERRSVDDASAEALDARALAHLAEGQLALAEDAARRALAADALYAPAHNTLGLVHVRRGELDLARAEFARASALDPALFAAVMNEALLALDTRDFDLASTLLDRAIALRPNDYDAWLALGVARRAGNDTHGARAAYERALAIDAARPDAYFDLAVLLDEFSDGTEPTLLSARAHYEQFVLRAGTRPEYAEAVARVEEHCGPSHASRRRRWRRTTPCGRPSGPIEISVELMREAALMQAEMERIQAHAAAQQGAADAAASERGDHD